MGKRKKKLTERQLILKIDRLVKKHGKVRLISQDAGYEPPCDCMCKSCKARYADDYQPDQRRRLIDKKGNCSVSYKTPSEGYNNWSGFETSCFIDNYYEDQESCCKCGQDSWECECERSEPKKTVKQTLRYLLDHDRHDLKPVIVEYGKRFSKKVKL